jgi:hypothetical protein
MSDGISVGRRFVGIDLHLHRSVVAGLDEAGDQLGWVRIDNDPKALVREVRKAGGRGCASKPCNATANPRSGRCATRSLPAAVVVELPRQLLVGQGVAGAAAVDFDAGLEVVDDVGVGEHPADHAGRLRRRVRRVDRQCLRFGRPSTWCCGTWS